jgi:hypothetical protein
MTPGNPDILSRYQELEKAWIELLNCYLPFQGGADDFWRYSHEALTGLPRQGWKIHVSGTLLNGSEILRIVGPILRRRELVFKGVSSLSELGKLNCGLYYGYSQIGKFLTIYPPAPDIAAATAQELAYALRGQSAPAVPFETRVADNSPVFARFGLFRSEDGTEGRLKTPEGTEEADSRQVNPKWATVPSGLFLPLQSPAKGPLATSFRAYGFVSQRGKGGVYRALDLEAVPPRHCVLKEGRRFGEIDVHGEDGYSRVTLEVEILRELEQRGIPVPRTYATFEQSNHRYIVMEWMPGGSLGQRLFAPDKKQIALADALDLCVQIAGLVCQIHQCGWVWRDLKATNLLIDGNERLRPIDFEGAARCGSPISSPWGSPGHVPPEWEKADRASFAQDQFALGAVLRQIFTLENPLEKNRRPISEVRPDVPADLEGLIADLLHEEPDMRPSALDAVAIVEREISSLRRAN